MKKSSKKSVIVSAMLAIAMSASVAAGATYAIFTSESSTNIAVTSGTVDVKAKIDNMKTYSGDGITGDPETDEEKIKETDKNGIFKNLGTAELKGDTLTLNGVTPGDRVTFDVIISNYSTVNVKYRMRVSYDNDNGLFDELKIKFGDYTSRVVTIWEDLAPNSLDKTLNCSVELPTDSSAMGKSCNISFMVEAVQGNAEVKNDKHYPIDTASLTTALTYGGEVNVEKDIDADTTLATTQKTTLNMNGKTLSNKNDIWDNKDAWSLISARESADLTITGNGTFQAKENDCYTVDVRDGATLTIENGTFVGNIHAVYVHEGKAEIKGGFFKVLQKYPDAAKADGFVLNCLDANREAGTASIIVYGGTFVNFNPADCWAEGEHTNFVADGYSVVSETKDNGEIWYTVVKGTGVVAGSQEALNDGITNAEHKDVTVVMPKNASVTLDNGIANEGAKAKNITFKGELDENGKPTSSVDVAKNAPSAEGAKHLNYQRGSSFIFENITIENGTDTYDGIVCDELIYKNCVIKGVTTLYGKATFIDCTFENTMENQYSIWTWGGTEVTFEGCTFNTNGKAILLFGEEKITNLTVNNCIFNDRNNGARGKAAIEIGEANYGKHNNFTVVINNSKVETGFAINKEGTNTGSKLWANKNSMDAAHLSVTIDKVKVL